ncbi:SDR family oxidoreductase [Roseimaritima ulvae]|uniref:NAD dependent epimerase/dehydratase family protein n=1 Tax=Roseimaritima ulvae TaxID=980254 RepID=A0A5B9R902_9BACT|nr:SDR family oxidoreductase [Roseimaritima ulvae]QEG43391.1 NAD dependent epimerase/dehydratase family protein [Roseimaritima ulvae]
MSNEPLSAASGPGRALIVGCGYLGRRVASRLLAEGWQVAATTRKQSRVKELERMGVEPVVADWTDRRSLLALPPHDRVLVAVAYDAASGASRYETQFLGFRNLLLATDPAADLCYVSTTGVFHQSGGEWVDERSPCRPRQASARVHLEAEQLLTVHRRRGPWCVLRLAGIYGPDRVPRVRNVLSGQPIEADPQSFLNLIHVEDAAAAVIECWRAGPHKRQRYYVVSDGVPVRREAFYSEVSRITGGPQPQFQAPNSPTASRRGGDKRIWNAAVRRDLLPQLQFPSYRDGLRAILSH